MCLSIEIFLKGKHLLKVPVMFLTFCYSTRRGADTLSSPSSDYFRVSYCGLWPLIFTAFWLLWYKIEVFQPYSSKGCSKITQWEAWWIFQKILLMCSSGGISLLTKLGVLLWPFQLLPSYSGTEQLKNKQQKQTKTSSLKSVWKIDFVLNEKNICR